MAEELPLFLGLNDKTVIAIPKTVEKQRYMTSVAPKAANPGKWVEQPRMPIPTGEHAVIECQGKIHSDRRLCQASRRPKFPSSVRS